MAYLESNREEVKFNFVLIAKWTVRFIYIVTLFFMYDAFQSQNELVQTQHANYEELKSLYEQTKKEFDIQFEKGSSLADLELETTHNYQLTQISKPSTLMMKYYWFILIVATVLYFRLNRVLEKMESLTKASSQKSID